MTKNLNSPAALPSPHVVHVCSGTWPSPLSPEHTMNTVPMHHAPHGTPSLGSVQMPDSANILAQALPSVLSSYAGAHGPQYMMPGPMGDPAHAAIFAAAAAAAATAAAQMQARGIPHLRMGATESWDRRRN